ncbi:hypothetical protein BDA96_02G419100 [Sorghum bicolor]|uniref:Uncharacterized protein n=2 Tax=Sorghum bicolor TaxID=4558 RepID=C5X429_SORBI|nr:uncharacterized protein LOC8073122 [Sorghum bicolor]XP_021308724.1 uncharacterized protein LOC8073122 [Sorghum bicolor]XP_021308725.1 uncharacterized protein LOC8073122 [Sorghum bicolor]XP_021308726.1 uncharacterized protein LOC8073122 [Sorghum bicolor]XP_021308727.1 uncharacterized protein LOC8073122 [Sorghum bicolor]EER99813.1 hypothetical protein SORBI_3002G399000 [Sorghum bicolor]KAG0546105.1 hypothetical protein BDA96_02G419100 [Sorghum bicolor]KXG36825.1 hypothetical protein SORBI_3|eukprot:XP_002463292.1 uncharacterized protein LOC8073122 [Sorghum bicolor]
MNHSQGSRIVRGRGRNKRMWTADEDDELVKALCEVSADPRYKVEGGAFKNCYSQGIENILAQKLPGRGIKASPHVDSRLKVMKRKYYSIKDMLSLPGFSWDDTRKMIQCEKQRYDEYCRDHPRAKGLYGVPFVYFDTFDAIYGKDRSAGEGLEGSEDAIANMENEITNEVGDDEVEEDRVSTGISGRSLPATLSSKSQKKYTHDGKRNRTESNCPSLDKFKDVHVQFQNAIQHASTMAAAMELFKDVHDRFQSVVQHAGAMAAAMELFNDAHTRFQSVVQHVNTSTTVIEQFKDALDHFQSITQNGKVIAAVEYDTEMQEKSMCEEPQRKAKVTAIAEVLKLGFSGTEVVTTASIFAKEPNQMDMFLALPEIYKKDYILQMLSGAQCIQYSAG